MISNEEYIEARKVVEHWIEACAPDSGTNGWVSGRMEIVLRHLDSQVAIYKDKYLRAFHELGGR